MKSRLFLIVVMLLLAACTTKTPRSPFNVDGERAQQIDARVIGLGHPRQESIETLAQRLISGLDDETERLYAIHRWVSHHIEYDVDAYLSGRQVGGSALETYQSGKAICDGYADLVVALGRSAGIDVKKITGYAKGFGELPLSAAPGKENHAWNAVQLEGQWHLLDATWDAGGVDDATRRFVRRPAGPPAYFLASPAAFITTHFPADRKWQLIEPKMEFATFLGKAVHRPDLVRRGLNLSHHTEQYITVSDTPYAFNFGSDKRMQASLSRTGGVPERPWSLQIRTPEGGSRLLLAAPEADEYQVTVYMAENPTDTLLQPVLNYQVRFDSANNHAQGFPQTYSGYFAHKVELISPLEGHLEAGKAVQFKLKSVGARQMMLFQGNEVVTELKEQGDHFVGQTMLPPGRIDLAAIHEGESDYQSILTYQSIAK